MAFRKRSMRRRKVSFKNHRHIVRKNMRGLTSIPVRFRGRRY